MSIPNISHTQYLILSFLEEEEKKGRELRNELQREGLPKSGPSFYQMMSRMEQSGLVEGRYSQVLIDGQIIKERIYTITGPGIGALNTTAAFYRRIRDFRFGLGGANA